MQCQALLCHRSVTVSDTCPAPLRKGVRHCFGARVCGRLGRCGCQRSAGPRPSTTRRSWTRWRPSTSSERRGPSCGSRPCARSSSRSRATACSTSAAPPARSRTTSRRSAARRSASTPSRSRSRRRASSSPDSSFQLANVARLPFEDGSFDKAVAADLVEHLDDETFRAMLVETQPRAPAGRHALALHAEPAAPDRAPEGPRPDPGAEPDAHRPARRGDARGDDARGRASRSTAASGARASSAGCGSSSAAAAAASSRCATGSACAAGDRARTARRGRAVAAPSRGARRLRSSTTNCAP